MEAAKGGVDRQSRDLAMPMDFFDLLLTHVHKEKLWRHVRQIFLAALRLHCEIPDGGLVVLAGGHECSRFGGTPFDGRDRALMVLEASHWFLVLKQSNDEDIMASIRYLDGLQRPDV